MADSLLRSFNGDNRVWHIFSEAEAKQRGIEYKPWRDCEEGDWALTDDGYVCEVVKVMGPYRETSSRGYTRYQYTFPFTRQWKSAKPLNYSEYVKQGMRPWLAEELSRPRFRRALSLYCELIMEHGFPLSDRHMRAVGLSYRPDQQIPEASFKRVMKYNEAKAMMASELRALLSKNGFSPDRIVEMYSDAFEMARKTGNPAAMRSIAKDLADMSDMKPTASKEVNSMESADFTLLDDVEDAHVLTEHPPLQIEE